MIWAVSVPYIKFVTIRYGMFSDAEFKYAIPQSHITFVEACTKDQALDKGLKEAQTTIQNAELIPQYVDAVMLPQQLLNQAMLEERNAT